MNIDVAVRRYSTLRIVATMADSDGAAINMTSGGTGGAWLSTGAGEATTAGTVTISDPTAGEVTVLFDDDVLDLSPGRYPWEAWLQLPTSGDRVAIGGTITVTAALHAPDWS